MGRLDRLQYGDRRGVRRGPTNFDWHFGETTEGLDLHDDFLTVAIHGIGHVMGFGTTESFDRFIDVGGMPLGTDNFFLGPQATAVWGGPVPLEGDSSFPLEKPITLAGLLGLGLHRDGYDVAAGTASLHAVGGLGRLGRHWLGRRLDPGTEWRWIIDARVGGNDAVRVQP